MRAVHVVVALAVVAAGCTTTEPAPPETTSSTAFAFAAPVLMPGERGGPEPTIAFAPDDATVYVAAQDPVGDGPRVWVKRSPEASWQLKRPTREGGGELSLAAGPDGAVYVTQLGTRGNIVSVSHDHGATWTTAPVGAVTQYFDRQWAAVDDRGRAYLLAREFGQNTAAALSRSDDGGVTWVQQGRAWDATNEPGTANGNLVAADGRLFLPYICKDARGVCVATSEDAGSTWRRAVVATPNARTDNVYPALAAAGDRVVVTWSDASAGRLAAWTSVSADAGRSWTPPSRLSAAAVTATMPWVAMGSSGSFAAFLESTTPLTTTDGRAAAEAKWVPHAVRLDSAGAARGSSVALTTEPVHVGVLSKPVGRPEPGAPFDRNFGDFFTAAVGSDGRFTVAVSRDTGTAESTRVLVIAATG